MDGGDYAGITAVRCAVLCLMERKPLRIHLHHPFADEQVIVLTSTGGMTVVIAGVTPIGACILRTICAYEHSSRADGSLYRYQGPPDYVIFQEISSVFLKHDMYRCRSYMYRTVALYIRARMHMLLLETEHLLTDWAMAKQRPARIH